MSAGPGLDRFVAAQANGVYEGALAELTFGHKVRHWMWFIFPQLRGLGHSEKAQFYGLDGVAEAAACLAHPLLGPRLVACTAAIATHAGVGPVFVLGEIDALKLRSCLTLFAAVPGAPSGITATLARLYTNGPDPATLLRLAAPRSGDN
ncbi:hypothetical protein IP88_12295 [alpha proteobacterium AAP81b]|nr:hypothetical protein IP88_12295 [alpha proteobacterium AAP81b]